MKNCNNHTAVASRSEKNVSFVADKFKMKKIAILFIMSLAPLMSFSQVNTIGYVDSEYILNEIPEYAEAQAELDKLSAKWQTEIEGLYKGIKKKRDALAEEAILLPDDVRKKREAKIKELETEAMQVQRQKFGVKGDLFQKREELIKPIQESVFTAIQTVAKQRKFSFVFDKANQSNLLYAKPNLDISERVLKMVKLNKKKGTTK
jgi:outer membrane protein